MGNAAGDARSRPCRPAHPREGDEGGREVLTTQINIAGHPGNDVDHVVLEGLGAFDRALLEADFVPIKDSKIGELAANFEIVLGRTPDKDAAARRG